MIIFSDGKRVQFSIDVYKAGHRRRLAAGLPFKLHFHVSRNTVFTLALTAEVPMKVISTLASHASIATTESYSHLINPSKIAGVDPWPMIGGTGAIGEG